MSGKLVCINAAWYDDHDTFLPNVIVVPWKSGGKESARSAISRGGLPQTESEYKIRTIAGSKLIVLIFFLLYSTRWRRQARFLRLFCQYHGRECSLPTLR